MKRQECFEEVRSSDSFSNCARIFSVFMRSMGGMRSMRKLRAMRYMQLLNVARSLFRCRFDLGCLEPHLPDRVTRMTR